MVTVGQKRVSEYFYPRPLRGGRRDRHHPHCGRGRISIHALCEEGDEGVIVEARPGLYISIHALCEEGDAFANFVERKIIISIHALCEEGDRTTW